MKKKTLTMTVFTVAMHAVACTKNENVLQENNSLLGFEEYGTNGSLDVVWCQQNERSDTIGKGVVMDMLWNLYGSGVLIILEPGNPDVGVVRCDNPTAKTLYQRMQMLKHGAKVKSVITKDKRERDNWARAEEKKGNHVVLWMDKDGFYYGLSYDDEEWCKLTGLGCDDE